MAQLLFEIIEKIEEHKQIIQQILGTTWIC